MGNVFDSVYRGRTKTRESFGPDSAKDKDRIERRGKKDMGKKLSDPKEEKKPKAVKKKAKPMDKEKKLQHDEKDGAKKTRRSKGGEAAPWMKGGSGSRHSY
jgi:hypothetical protein